LGFCNKGFCFGTDEFLFEDDDFGGGGFFVLQMGYLVSELLFAIPGGLDGGLDIADLFEC
jgi:hypothetical protein